MKLLYAIAGALAIWWLSYGAGRIAVVSIEIIRKGMEGNF